MRAKSIKNTARVNTELSPAELKALLKKSQSTNTSYQTYITALEAELAIWRSGGKVDPADYASATKTGAPATPAAKKAPPPTASSSRSMTPAIPALDNLRDLESRPQTPTAVGLDRDERDEFLKRENELTDQLGEKVKSGGPTVLLPKLCMWVAERLDLRNLNSQLKPSCWRRFARSWRSLKNRKPMCPRFGIAFLVLRDTQNERR